MKDSLCRRLVNLETSSLTKDTVSSWKWFLPSSLTKLPDLSINKKMIHELQGTFWKSNHMRSNIYLFLSKAGLPKLFCSRPPLIFSKFPRSLSVKIINSVSCVLVVIIQLKNNNIKALVPNAYKTQTHWQTPCLHLSLPLLQYHLQYRYYRYRATFLTRSSLIRI